MMKWTIKNSDFDYSGKSVDIVNRFNNEPSESVNNEIMSSYTISREEIIAKTI